MHRGLLFDGVHIAVALRKDSLPVRVYCSIEVGGRLDFRWQGSEILVVKRRACAEFEARFGPRFMLPWAMASELLTAAHLPDSRGKSSL